MTEAERYKQAEALFFAALELEPDRRAAFLAQACGSDLDLLAKVEFLLETDERTGSFIKAPAYQAAAELLAKAGSRVGEVISHYQILALLGRGGMGEVYLAQDTRLERKVALKLLPTEFTIDQDRVRRFAQEARAASALNHPNILTIYEIGQVGETHFIATEFVAGQTLRQQMAGTGLELSAALEVAMQVAGALAAAHAAGITHRDIKPENIMVRPDGYVKVLDFGLAKLKRPALASGPGATTAMTSTYPGVVLGTPRYMSPEQARGLDVDARSDLFSLGIVLYEMITGRVPFEGTTTMDVLVSILEKEPAPLSLSWPEASAELERIVSQALQKDREERYQTAAALLLDLRRLKQRLEFGAALAREPERSGGGAVPTSRKEGKLPAAETSASTSRVMAWVPASIQSLTKSIRRHQTSAGLTLVGLVLVLATVIYFPRPSSPPPPPPKALPRPTHWRTFDNIDNGGDDQGTGPQLIRGLFAPEAKLWIGKAAGNCRLNGSSAMLKGSRDSYVNFGSEVGQFGTRDFTVSLWFSATAQPSPSEVLSNRATGSGGNFFSLRLINTPLPQPTGSRWGFELCQDKEVNNFLELVSPGGFDDGKWHHLVVRRQEVQGAMFIDGALVYAAETIRRVGDGVTDIHNDQPWLLGTSPYLRDDPKARTFPFQGQIDELQIYDQALTNEEVGAVYAVGLDSDGDGVCDNVDQCPHSERSPTVVIAGCQADVPNHLLSTGCTLNDRLAGCAAAAQSHRQFVSCVGRFTAELVKAGNISAREKEHIEQCAASAKIP